MNHRILGLDLPNDRMPVILGKDEWPIWLDPNIQGAEGVQSLLVPNESEIWQRWPVSRKINGVKYDGPDATTPITLSRRLFH